jgi:hypothetical protein
LRRRGGSFVSKCSGTTTSGQIKRSGIEGPFNTARNKQRRWLDFRGALHLSVREFIITTALWERYPYKRIIGEKLPSEIVTD